MEGKFYKMSAFCVPQIRAAANDYFYLQDKMHI